MNLRTAIPSRTTMVIGIILTTVVAALMLWPAPDPAQGQTLPVIQFDNSDTVLVTEGDSDIEVVHTVVISPALTQSASVKYRVKSSETTAPEGLDFNTIGVTTVTLQAGSVGFEIPLTIRNDDRIEVTEHLIVELFDPSGMTLGSIDTKRISIGDSDQSESIRIHPVDGQTTVR